MNEKWHQKLADTAYGDASWWTRRQVMHRIKVDPEARRRLEAFQAEARAVSTLARESLPEELETRLRQIPAQQPLPDFAPRANSRESVSRPPVVWAGGMVVATLLVVFLVGRFQPPAENPGQPGQSRGIDTSEYSAAELARAEAEVKYSLALIQEQLELGANIPVKIITEEINKISNPKKETT